MSDAQDKRSVPSKDFVLLIRDSQVNVPTGFYSVNQHNEQAFMVSILTDVTPAAKRRQKLMADVDSDPNLYYQINSDEEVTE